MKIACYEVMPWSAPYRVPAMSDNENILYDYVAAEGPVSQNAIYKLMTGFGLSHLETNKVVNHMTRELNVLRKRLVTLDERDLD